MDEFVILPRDLSVFFQALLYLAKCPLCGKNCVYWEKNILYYILILFIHYYLLRYRNLDSAHNYPYSIFTLSLSTS